MSQTLKFDRVVPEGKALAKHNGKATFCIGPLPDEIAEVAIKRQKRYYNEAVLKNLIKPSRQRNGEAEEHALSCSPWQDVAYPYQLELKAGMIAEAMKQQKLTIEASGVVAAPEQFHYRNRLDFTATKIEGSWQLAFHQRGSWEVLLPLQQGCRLGSKEMNAAALEVIQRLNDLDFPEDELMITVRQSYSTKAVVVVITTSIISYDWAELRLQNISGMVIARPQSGSGSPGEAIFQCGDVVINEKLAGLEITYPFDSFFQTNVPAFSVALKEILKHVSESKHVVELYSGVGSIGLPVAKQVEKVTAVEIVASSVEYARRNAIINSIGNYHEYDSPAEKVDPDIYYGADAVIVDPPRAGLHPKVIKRLLEHRPKRIIYLSCNPVTQARDAAMLAESYRADSLVGFDFYPGTLHVESLMILERKLP